MFKTTANCSNIWRGIVENSHVIQQGAQAAVGNGRTTLFWDDKWVTNVPLLDLAVKEAPIEVLASTVEEMWDKTGDWKWEKFSEYLPLEVAKRIQACEFSNDPNAIDSFSWNVSSNGVFSIKSAMNIIIKVS